MKPTEYKLWHKEDKCWREDYHYHLAPSGQLYYGGMNITDRYEVVFFTGLKDRNGVEIWEGDLYKIEGNWPTYQVIFDDKTAAFGLKSKSGPFYSFGKLQERNEIISEKLGNIYQDSHLLEQ